MTVYERAFIKGTYGLKLGISMSSVSKNVKEGQARSIHLSEVFMARSETVSRAKPAPNDEADEVLKRTHAIFRKYLNVHSIYPHLRSHNLITDHEWEVINTKDGREGQVDELLKCLPQKGRDCLQLLVKCLQSSLDHAGHKDLLVELLKQPEMQTKVSSVK